MVYCNGFETEEFTSHVRTQVGNKREDEVGQHGRSGHNVGEHAWDGAAAPDHAARKEQKTTPNSAPLDGTERVSNHFQDRSSKCKRVGQCPQRTVLGAQQGCRIPLLLLFHYSSVDTYSKINHILFLSPRHPPRLLLLSQNLYKNRKMLKHHHQFSVSNP